MRITEIMTAKVITVEMDDTLETVKEIFDNAKIHHLLVVENDELVGVVSDRDLRRNLSPNVGTMRFTQRDLDTLKIRVHMVMTRHPVTLDENASVEEAITIFNTHNFSCIPVVGKNNEVAGIVSWRDILRHFDAIIADKLRS